MTADVAREVEAPLDRGVEVGGDIHACHPCLSVTTRDQDDQQSNQGDEDDASKNDDEAQAVLWATFGGGVLVVDEFVFVGQFVSIVRVI